MKERRADEERTGFFGKIHGFYERYLRATLRFRWILAALYLVICIGFLWVALPRMGTEIFPDVKAPMLQIRLRAPTGTRIEETEPLVLRALDVIRAKSYLL
jgi:multidrug efflux pump subunit AcrB